MTLPVIFRKGGGEVTAVFPTLPWDRQGHLTIYAHVGQHGGASFGWYNRTRAATPEEYRPLLRELRGIYERDLAGEGAYPLRVYKRMTRHHRQAFQQELQRI